jgi:hypothetical protein
VVLDLGLPEMDTTGLSDHPSTVPAVTVTVAAIAIEIVTVLAVEMDADVVVVVATPPWI